MVIIAPIYMYIKLGTSKRIYLAKCRCEAISYQP